MCEATAGARDEHSKMKPDRVILQELLPQVLLGEAALLIRPGGGGGGGPAFIQKGFWVLNSSQEKSTLPFFLEHVEGKSLSSTFTEGLLHFILQKNDRLAPEQSLEGPGVMSVFTGRPAVSKPK